MRWRRVLNAYGITKDGYYQILEQQENKCAICGTEDPGRNDTYFAIDHCHVTELVRGLLCQKCNCGIGFFQDDPNLLRSALNYLEDAYGERRNQS